MNKKNQFIIKKQYNKLDINEPIFDKLKRDLMDGLKENKIKK